MKNISFKVGLIYILFTIFNISFFTVSIYIEQNGLIVKNRELEIQLRTEKIFTPLKYAVIDSLGADINKLQQKTLVNKITAVLEGITKEDYIIFTDKGDILYQSPGAPSLEDRNRNDAISAIANKEFLNKPYLIQTYNTDEAYLYIPVSVAGTDDIVLFFKYRMEDLETNLMNLYRVVITVIIIVLAFQIIFGIMFYSMVIRPVKEINRKSLEIKAGNLSSRVNLNRKDELGQLAQSFNEMAASIEKKIVELKEKNEIMEFELNTAGKVQAGIYPRVRSSDFFDVAIYHRPLGIVSGDYHDIFKMGDDKYGFLIVDVSGHGVPAALITMRIQNTFKRLVSKYDDPGKLFASINTELVDLMERFSCYFTAFYFSLVANRKIIFTNGGHPTVYLLKAGSKKIFELKTDGFFLGLTKDVNDRFQSKTTKIEPGDKIILFSDGMIEAKNSAGEQYTEKRLLLSIQKNASLACESMKKNLVEDLNAYIGDAKRKDDETLMIIEIKKAIPGKKIPGKDISGKHVPGKQVPGRKTGASLLSVARKKQGLLKGIKP